MTIGVEVLDLAVIGPFVRDVESGRNGASIGVNTTLFEEVRVQALVEVVHRIVEGQQDDLGHLINGYVAYGWWWLVHAHGRLGGIGNKEIHVVSYHLQSTMERSTRSTSIAESGRSTILRLGGWDIPLTTLCVKPIHDHLRINSAPGCNRSIHVRRRRWLKLGTRLG